MEARNSMISVVIPVKNGAKTLKDCIEGILNQKTSHDIEIIIIDSGSTDNTINIAKKYPETRILSIDPQDFNHGLTRNLGVQHSKGEYVVMTVQDACPVDDHWLEKLLVHFDDPNVAGVCGQQIVPHHKDKNPHQWFRPVNPPNSRKVHFESPEDYEKLLPVEKKRCCSWDNVNAMYRKSGLLILPFRNAFFAEDALWAQDALIAGYTLVYDTSARVYHYHFMSYSYAYRRILTQLYFTYKTFNFIPKHRLNLKQYLLIIYRNFKYKAAPKWIWHNFSLAWARKKAFDDFNHWLKIGDEHLDKQFSKTIHVPPQGNLSARNQLLTR